MAEFKLDYIVYKWPAVCTIQLIITWRRAGIIEVLLTSDNGEQTGVVKDYGLDKKL